MQKPLALTRIYNRIPWPQQRTTLFIALIYVIAWLDSPDLSYPLTRINTQCCNYSTYYSTYANQHQSKAKIISVDNRWLTQRSNAHDSVHNGEVQHPWLNEKSIAAKPGV